MKYLSPILLGLSALLGLIALILTSLTIGSHDEHLDLLSEFAEKKTALMEELKEQKLVNESKSSRERKRNQELEDQLSTTREECEGITGKLADTKARLEKINQAKVDAEKSLDDVSGRIKEAEANLAEAKESGAALESEIPMLRQRISQSAHEMSDLVTKISDLSSSLEEFPAFTAILKRHYQRALKGLSEYARERPWLEMGEVVSLKFDSIDYSKGLVSLPLGSEAGIKPEMILGVRRKSLEICKIRITRIHRFYSLAEIIPMVGRPLDLKSHEKFDLVVL